MNDWVVIGAVSVGALLLLWLVMWTTGAGPLVRIERWLDKRAERASHNDRDAECRYWWGDRSGSAVGVLRERCRVCNPIEGLTHRDPEVLAEAKERIYRQRTVEAIQEDLGHTGSEGTDREGAR